MPNISSGVGNSGAAAAVEVAPGGSVDFFSDADIASQTAEAEGAEIEEVEQEVEEGEPGSKDGEDDSELEGSEEAEDEQEEEEKPGKAGKKKEEEPKRPVGRPKKGFDVKIGDKVERLPPETEVTVKVDGKEQKVSLADLTSEFSGKTNWTAKHQELANERKSLETERNTFHVEQQTVNHRITEMYKLATEKKDPRALIYYIADALGANGAQIWHQMLGQVREQLKAAGVQVPGDDDPAIRAQRAEDESAYYRDRDARNAESARQASERQTWETRTKKVQESYGVDAAGQPVFSDRELVRVYDKLLSSGYKEDQITPELCGQAFAWDRATTVAQNVLKSLKTEVDNPEKAIKLLREAKLANPEFTESDLKQIASEVLGDLTKKVASSLSKKVRTAGAPPRQPKPEKSTKHEAVFFDDL